MFCSNVCGNVTECPRLEPNAVSGGPWHGTPATQDLTISHEFVQNVLVDSDHQTPTLSINRLKWEKACFVAQIF